MNEYVNVDLNNIENEHLCCAISDKKHQDGVNAKKDWLRKRINEGHVFRKLNANGKIFIEFSPLETAWVPISGNNYLYIYCLWVAGSYKGSGHGKDLLEYAIKYAKDKKMNGICTLTSKKKKPFLSEKNFFEKYDFKVVDNVDDYELLALSFNNELPKFNDCVKEGTISEKDLTIYYTPQCPYTSNCIKEINEYKIDNNVKINIIKIDSLKRAKEIPCIFNNWAIFKNGKFISNTLLNKNSLEKLLKEDL